MSKQTNDGRPLPPTARTTFASDRPFRVWASMPLVLEDRRPFKCTATFRYLLEALDYADSIAKRGVTCWLQSPSGVAEHPAWLSELAS